MKILKKYSAPKCCGDSTELKSMLYDGGHGDLGAFLFLQCRVCGSIIKTRINDAKVEGNN